MTIQKTAISTSIVLALGLSIPAFAQTEGQPEAMEGTASVTIIDGDAVTIECVPQAEVDAMTVEDKGKLTLPVCEDAGASDGEKNADGSKAVTQ